RRHIHPARESLGDVARLAAQWLFGRPSLYGIPASLQFLRLGESIHHAPRASRAMSRIASAALVTTWPLASGEAAARRQRAADLLRHAGPGLTPIPIPNHTEAGYLRLPFVASTSSRAAAATPAA